MSRVEGSRIVAVTEFYGWQYKCILFAEIGETIGGSAISSSFSAP